MNDFFMSVAPRAPARIRLMLEVVPGFDSPTGFVVAFQLQRLVSERVTAQMHVAARGQGAEAVIQCIRMDAHVRSRRNDRGDRFRVRIDHVIVALFAKLVVTHIAVVAGLAAATNPVSSSPTTGHLPYIQGAILVFQLGFHVSKQTVIFFRRALLDQLRDSGKQIKILRQRVSRPLYINGASFIQ